MAKLGISTGTVPNDGNGDSLLIGAIKINSNFNEIYNYFGDGTNLNFSNVDVWNRTGSGINTLSNVGIATTNPRFSLEVGSIGAAGTSLWVNGSARITGILTIGSSSITLNGSTNVINVGSGVTINGSSGTISATSINIGGQTLTGVGVTSITAGSGISVNQSTGNVTITATGGGGSSQWVTTASGIHTLSNVGIGTTNATSRLTVVGSGASISQLYVTGISTFVGVSTFNGGAYFNSPVYYSNNPTRAYFGSLNEMSIYSTGTYTGTSFNYIDANSGYIDIRNLRTTIRNPETTTQRDLAIFDATTFDGEFVKLYYGGNEKFATVGAGVTVTGTTFTNQLNVGTGGTIITTSSAGSVGIGTTNPAYKLTVYDGSIALQSPGKNPLDISQLVNNTFIIRTSGNDAISIAPNNSIKLTVNNSGALVSGILTATSFVGDGSGLTGVVGSGSGVVIKDSGSTVGTAGTIDFGDNLTVSAVSAGVVTVTASGGGSSSQWVTTAAGIHTLSNVGVGTTNPTSALTVLGNASVSGIVTATSFIGFIQSEKFYSSGIVTSNTVLSSSSANSLIPVSTGSSITVTLPAGSGLSAGDGFRFVDVGSSETSSGNAATYNITITPNAADRIMGGPAGDSLIIDQNGASVKLVWMGSTYDWRIV